MKSPERVHRAVHHEKPDRVPYIGYNGLYPLLSDVLPLVPLTPKTFQPPFKEGYYPHVHPMQLSASLYRWDPPDLKGTKYARSKKRQLNNWKRWKYIPHKEIDEWGVIWEQIGDGTMGWPVEGPLKNWDDLDSLIIPDGRDPQRYALVRKLCKIVPKGLKYRLGIMDNFIFERTHFIRGWDNYLRDLVRNPHKIQELIKKILPYYEGLIHQLHEMGARAIFTTDDWGSQEDVFISQRLFDKIFAQPYKTIIDLVHDLGMDFWLHSCGNIGKFIPKFIELGVDALQLDSPRMTGLDILAKYSEDMAYINCIDIQTIYPFVDAEGVVREFIAMKETLGMNGGGLVAIDYTGAHSVLHVPKENIRAFYRAVKKYGKYRW